MIYYKSKSGEVYAYETEEYRDQYGGDDLVKMTTSQIEAHLNPPVVATVPAQIAGLDGLLTLDAAGLGSAYEAWASAPERTFAERAFIDKAMTWKRNDPTILAAAEALGLSAEQVDELFTQAAKR